MLFFLPLTDSACPLVISLSDNASVIAVNLSDYVSGQIPAYPQAGSGGKGDGGVSDGCRVEGEIKAILNYLPCNEFPEVSFLISGVITVGSCRGCLQALEDVAEIESNENK